MMTQPITITKAPLPITQNFGTLKTKGLSLLQTLSGENWTNFNPSDPGITTLEQLCYALTELGYCLDFPMEDILSEDNLYQYHQLCNSPRCQPKESANIQGKPFYNDQFFRPKDILTTAPVTEQDYQKWLFDKMPNLINIHFDPVDNEQDPAYPGTFYLQFSFYSQYSPLVPHTQVDQHAILQQELAFAQRLLAQSRTLGEPPFKAQLGKISKRQLSGLIYLRPHADAHHVQARIQQALNDLLHPKRNVHSYDDLCKQGWDPADIFNGPVLTNGWLKNDELLQTLPISRLSAAMLVPILTQIEGIEAIDQIELTSDTNNEDQTHFLEFDIARLTYHQAGKQWQQNNSVQQANLAPSPGQDSVAQQSLKLAVNNPFLTNQTQLQPKKIRGKFRHIEQYYSVQYTFPSIYGIGANTLPDSAGAARLAQAKQLQGYLLIYDQLLANQFSQLAHLRELFSFKEANRVTEYINKRSDKPDYAARIPRLNFSPTYFSQPLYPIRAVSSLLKGYQEFQFSAGQEPRQTLISEAWKKFRQDPFNPYISGLREKMESNDQALKRRETMLNHLLARHGEDSDFIDLMISIPIWYGSLIRTRILIKGHILQNYARLSYYRTQGYNLHTAAKLLSVTENIDNNQHTLKASKPLHTLTRVKHFLLQAPLEQAMHCLLGKPWPIGYQDGRLNIELLDQAQKISLNDIDNFSTFELLFDLTTGLRHYYQLLTNLLLQVLRSDFLHSGLQQAKYLSRGISASPQQQKSHPEHLVTLEDGTQLRLRKTQQALLLFSSDREILNFTYRHGDNIESLFYKHLLQMAWLATQRRGVLLIEQAIYPDICQQKSLKGNGLTSESDRIYTCLPAYVSHFSSPEFAHQFQQFANRHCPVHITNTLITMEFAPLNQLIKDYVAAHNRLIVADDHVHEAKGFQDTEEQHHDL